MPFSTISVATTDLTSVRLYTIANCERTENGQFISLLNQPSRAPNINQDTISFHFHFQSCAQLELFVAKTLVISHRQPS